MLYLLMLVGAGRRWELSLVDELLSQFTQRLTDAATSKQFITGAIRLNIGNIGNDAKDPRGTNSRALRRDIMRRSK